MEGAGGRLTAREPVALRGGGCRGGGDLADVVPVFVELVDHAVDRVDHEYVAAVRPRRVVDRDAVGDEVEGFRREELDRAGGGLRTVDVEIGEVAIFVELVDGGHQLAAFFPNLADVEVTVAGPTRVVERRAERIPHRAFGRIAAGETQFEVVQDVFGGGGGGAEPASTGEQEHRHQAESGQLLHPFLPRLPSGTSS